jgi:hypothetical protein
MAATSERRAQGGETVPGTTPQTDDVREAERTVGVDDTDAARGDDPGGDDLSTEGDAEPQPGGVS